MSNLQKDFSKKIQEICTVSKIRNRPKDVFDDLIQLACNLLTEEAFIRKAFNGSFDRVNENIRTELSHYKNDPKAWELLNELMMLYLNLIEESEPFDDVLGALYDEYLGEVLGQFLTPKDVAHVISKLIADDIKMPLSPITMGDDTGCGAGSLILAQLHSIYKTHGKDALKNIHVHLVDLDPRMIRMATAQIGWSAAIHQAPLRTLTGWVLNVISEYENVTIEQADVLIVFNMFLLNTDETLLYLKTDKV